MAPPNLLRRARFYLLLDTLLAVLRFPFRLVVWILSITYVLFCMVSWGFILWVLGEKHIGILKMLIMFSSVMVWILIFSSFYSLLG